jgi:hypothetical protein
MGGTMSGLDPEVAKRIIDKKRREKERNIKRDYSSQAGPIHDLSSREISLDNNRDFIYSRDISSRMTPVSEICRENHNIKHIYNLDKSEKS